MPDSVALRPLIRDLRAAVADLQSTPLEPALPRLLLLLVLLTAAGIAFWQFQAWPLRLAAALMVALAETLLFIASHEACPALCWVGAGLSLCSRRSSAGRWLGPFVPIGCCTACTTAGMAVIPVTPSASPISNLGDGVGWCSLVGQA